jgi:hypothetical protein
MVSLNRLSRFTGRVTILASLLLGGFFLETRDTAQAATSVVPENLSTREGNANNSIPFNNLIFSDLGLRYQQVFAATEFTSIDIKPQWITEIAFRPNGGLADSAFSSTIDNILINLSTSKSGPDALSTTFDDNAGGDEKTVYSGSILLSSADTGPSGGPKDFDIVIDLQNPFLYDPNQGNLLLDVRTFSSTKTTSFDAEKTPGDSISRVYSLDPNASIADVADTTGLVTKFTTTTATSIPEPTAIPEPSSTVGVLAVGALTGVSLLKRKQKEA